jgi:uncharacterized protein
MKILAVADTVVDLLYSPAITRRFQNISFVIGCGDLPYYYLDYISGALNIPLYFVQGNHTSRVEIGIEGDKKVMWAGTNLHKRCVQDESGVLLAGIEGSIRYNNGPYQYSQGRMWGWVFDLVPGLFINRLRTGRYLDIFVTHSPMWHVHDMEDLPHNGIKAFCWLVTVFKPAYHLHGHVHVYRNDAITISQVRNTTVMNTYGYKEITLESDFNISLKNRVDNWLRENPQVKDK